MSFKELLPFVSSVIAAAGGSSVVVLICIRFCAKFIADRFAERYSHMLDQKTEKYKTQLENKQYVTKVKFDTEFSIYRELSTTFFQMIKSIQEMIPAGLVYSPVLKKEEQDKYDKNIYYNAHNSVVAAQDMLYGNAAFITADVFDAYKEILILSNTQLNVFKERWVATDFRSDKEKRDLSMDDYKRTEEIIQKNLELSAKIREYIQSLEVLGD